MGVFTRRDSPWYWLYLETAPPGQRKEKTKVRVGTTTTQRHDSRALATEIYHQRMNAIAARVHRLRIEVPAIRFRKYAEPYTTDVIAVRRGADRERELLKPLLAFFGEELVQAIDADRVRAYMAERSLTVSARTVNREVDLLKGMLRDAVPKYLPVSPIVGLKRLRPVKPKRRLMTPTEERKLLKVGDAVDRALIIVATDGLIRLGDLLDLKRTDRARGWLYVADPKSGDPYDVALTPRAAKALDALRHTGPYYFAKFRKAENPRDWRGAVRQRLERLCAAADVPFGRKAHGLTFHWATRRTGAHRLVVKKKRPIPAVQRQGNWKTPDTLLAIYAEADRADQRKAIGAFPKRSRTKRKTA